MVGRAEDGEWFSARAHLGLAPSPRVGHRRGSTRASLRKTGPAPKIGMHSTSDVPFSSDFLASPATQKWECPDHLTILQGETSGHCFSASSAHRTVLSLWQVLQEFGIFIVSVAEGGMNLKVWLLTLTSASVCSILGMWQEMHSLPGLPTL